MHSRVVRGVIPKFSRVYRASFVGSQCVASAPNATSAAFRAFPRCFCSTSSTSEAADQTADSTALLMSKTATLKPSEIVAELDNYIIGQDEAKKAISIALRNRWRRRQLNEEMQNEIIPKNILMVGPTGCGKTEIARRLAKLANAPFVKVEATKFTEVGFHGRDVDTIIRDLMEASMQLVKQIKTEEYRSVVEPEVRRRILEAITGPEAREDTVRSFMELLDSGALNERMVEIDVPIVSSNTEVEMSLSGATVDVNELMSKLAGGNKRSRTERRKMKVKDAIPVLTDAELEKKLSQLDLKAQAKELAEQNGIVFIDEIDKIVSNKRRYSGGDASAEGVQRDLLPLIEGSTVDVRRFGNVKTDYILFVASGAFHETKPSDMLAELQGRLPIRVELKGLDAANLRRILVEPKCNLIEQQKALLAAEGIEVEFTDDALTTIAEIAAETNRTVENIGARRLHTVIERIMEDISFHAPEYETGTKIVVDAKLVKEKVGDMLKQADLSKFIL